MDARIAGWILEFVLRQPIDDWIVNRLLTALPLSNDDARLKKTILLRRISDDVKNGVLSEGTLDSLETVEALDPSFGSETMEAMRKAHAHVAVACTVGFLREGADDDQREYYAALQRIWRDRIMKMESEGRMGLRKKCTKETRKELEAFVVAVAGEERVRVSEFKRDALGVALESLRAFLKNAVHDLGPPFLQSVARSVQGKGGRHCGWEGVTFRCDVKDVLPVTASLPDDDIHYEETLNGDDGSIGSCKLGRGKTPAFSDSSQVEGNVSCEQLKEDRGLREKIGVLDSGMVHKVQAALKSSLLNLRNTVDDPLPNALEMVHEMAKVSDTGNHLSEKVSDGKKDPAFSSKASDSNHLGEPSTRNIKEDGAGSYSIHRRLINLFDRNKTARFHEWDDDSSDSLSEPSDSRTKDIHLPSPKKLKVSPLQGLTYYTKSMKQVKSKWSSLEEETLRNSVKDIGRVDWKAILQSHPEVFEGRSVKALKEKWRQMILNPKI